MPTDPTKNLTLLWMQAQPTVCLLYTSDAADEV